MRRRDAQRNSAFRADVGSYAYRSAFAIGNRTSGLSQVRGRCPTERARGIESHSAQLKPRNRSPLPGQMRLANVSPFVRFAPGAPPSVVLRVMLDVPEDPHGTTLAPPVLAVGNLTVACDRSSDQSQSAGRLSQPLSARSQELDWANERGLMLA